MGALTVLVLMGLVLFECRGGAAPQQLIKPVDELIKREGSRRLSLFKTPRDPAQLQESMALSQAKCPSGYSEWTTRPKCTGQGLCCKAVWTKDCNEACAKSTCEKAGGKWIPLDYTSNPYTCEIPQGPRPAPTPAPPQVCKVELYEHGDFTGWRAEFSVGDYDHAKFLAKGARNDDASAIKVHGAACKAVLYQHGDFTGWSATFTEGSYDHDAFVKKGAVNDDASAIKVSLTTPHVDGYQGQFMIPRWNEWKYTGPRGKIGICFGGGSDIGANTAARCNPGGKLFRETVKLTASDGDVYYDFGGGDLKPLQWFTEAKIRELDQYMDTLKGSYQGIFYDLETFHPHNFTVDSMYEALDNSFKLAKQKGLKVIASTSYTAPYKPKENPKSYSALVDALWMRILANPHVDIFSPQFYGWKGQNVYIGQTDGSSVTFSNWTNTISEPNGKIVPILKAWQSDYFKNQVGQMERACSGQIPAAFCSAGYILWGST